MPPVRIAMLTTFYPPYSFGGDAIGVQRLATALARRGCEVSVLHDQDAYTFLSGRKPAAVTNDSAVRVTGLHSAAGPASLFVSHQAGRPVFHAGRIRRFLAEGAFDVVWYHNISLLGGPGLLGYGSGLKVYEAHEHWLVCPTHVLWRYGRETCDERHCVRCVVSYRRPPQPWRYTGALERGLDAVDVLIAKSAFSRDMHRQFGFERPMSVVPYFLPDEPGRDDPQPPWSRPYFLFVGRLEKIKGLQDVLPAFAGTDGPGLLVVGSGEYEAELRRLAADMPRVRFAGRLPVDEIARYYRHAIALIVPSLCYETFGIILIEAFRSGTPVVARDIGPFPEIVRRGGGVLFTDGDTLASQLRRLHDERGHRDRLACEARAAFDAHWCEDVVVREYLDLLAGTAMRKGNRQLADALESMR